VSVGPLGGAWEMGTIVTDKGGARDYLTKYYAPGFASFLLSHTFFTINAFDSKNLLVFSDWAGLGKGAFGGTTLKGNTFIAFGGGLGSNYSVKFLGLGWAPAAANFMKDSKIGGGLAVGSTNWLGQPYRIPNNGASERYINTMKFMGGIK